MRILLDTNVLLTGAFEPASFANRLTTLRGKINVVVPARVRAECAMVISRRLSNSDAITAALSQLDQFAASAGVLWVDDAGQMLDVASKGGSADEAIIATARAHNCDAVCTYNIEDFEDSGLRIETPLSLVRTMSEHAHLESFIQVQQLGKEGTLLVVGSFVHASALGDIVRFEDGSAIGVESDGTFAARGAAIGRFHSFTSAPAGELLALVLRYGLAGEIEIICWSGIGEYMAWRTRELPERLLLATGRLDPSARPKFEFINEGPRYNFSGSLVGISAIPRFLRDQQLRRVLRSGSLEAVVGSSGLQSLQRLECIRSPDGVFVPHLRLPK